MVVTLADDWLSILFMSFGFLAPKGFLDCRGGKKII
jgi:hypothetical protein